MNKKHPKWQSMFKQMITKAWVIIKGFFSHNLFKIYMTLEKTEELIMYSKS